jgi:transposase
MKHCPKLTNNQILELQNIISSPDFTKEEARRAQSIILINSEAYPVIITTLTGFTEKHAYKLRRMFLNQGIHSIIDKRKPKVKELLTKTQRSELIKTIKDKTPNECDRYYNSDYWTTGIVAEYIKRIYNVTYKSKTSIYIVFRKSKFSYHKPSRIYERRNEQEVQEWRKEAQKQVKQAWKEKHTVILTEDEMSLSTQTTVQKIWLPQGEYPKIEVATKREARSIYGFLNIKTGQEHAFKTEWQNMYITAKILKKIRKAYPTQKILLLWDKAPSHKGSKAQEAIEKDKNIKTIYFPSAAPEQNPQEHVWKSGRSNVTHNWFIKDIDKATDDFVNYLNTTQFPYSFLGHGIKT